MYSFMIFHVIGISTSIFPFGDAQLQHFVASASQESFYGPSPSYSGFIFSKVPPLRGPGTTW